MVKICDFGTKPGHDGDFKLDAFVNIARYYCERWPHVHPPKFLLRIKTLTPSEGRQKGLGVSRNSRIIKRK